MNPETTVTVVVTCYNGSRYIGETIQSLLRQTYRDIKIVCVDNCSTDDTKSIVEKFEDPRVSYQRNDRNLGMAGNWNRAATVADTELFVIAHQDDTYEPGFIAAMKNLLDKSPQAFIAHSGAQTVNAVGEAKNYPESIFKDFLWPRSDPYAGRGPEQLRRLRQGNYITCSAVMYRRSAFRSIGPFREDLVFVTDWEYWFRGVMKGFEIVGTSQRLVRFRRHDETATRACEVTLQRYEEEVALLEQVEMTGAPYRTPPKIIGPRYRAVSNTVASAIAQALWRGDTKQAHRLIAFADEKIPGFSSSPTRGILSGAAKGGRAGGAILKAIEALLVRVLRQARKWTA